MTFKESCESRHRRCHEGLDSHAKGLHRDRGHRCRHRSDGLLPVRSVLPALPLQRHQGGCGRKPGGDQGALQGLRTVRGRLPQECIRSCITPTSRSWPRSRPRSKKTPEQKIIGFVCHWCALGGVDMAGVSRLQYPVPCPADPRDVLGAGLDQDDAARLRAGGGRGAGGRVRVSRPATTSRATMPPKNDSNGPRKSWPRPVTIPKNSGTSGARPPTAPSSPIRCATW